MHQKTSIQLTAKSKISTVDFNNIPFGKIFTDHMFICDFDGAQWIDPRIVPLEEMPVHPGNLAWHYGQSIFEGMKATINAEGTPLLFRPEKHVDRLNASAERMCMPTIPGEIFLDGLKKLILVDKNWIPPQEGSALYIRPFMIAMDSSIGVRPSLTYRFIIICLPVGPYYSKPVRLKAAEKYVRAVKGGVGEAKTAGNYAASLLPARIAQSEGYDQMMWLDPFEFKYIQEVGTMNIFFVIGDEIITPATDGAILKGITRMTALDVFRSEGKKVSERPLTIDEVVDAYHKGTLKEVFGTGTAAVVAKVAAIKYKDLVMEFDSEKFEIADQFKSFIDKVRIGKIEDKHGWVVPVKDESLDH